jgi:hypothetical protein
MRTCRDFTCAIILTLVAAAGIPAQPECDPSLTAAGVGAYAPKYPKVGAEDICEGGIHNLSMYGHDYYWGWDRGGFLYRTIAPDADFTFTARFDSLGPTQDVYKVGLCVREGLLGNERAVQLRYDSFFGGDPNKAQIAWFYRMVPGYPTSEFCSDADRYYCFREGGTGITDIVGRTMSISRRSGLYELDVDGVRVAEEEQLKLAPNQPMYVGVIGSFGGADRPRTGTFTVSEIGCEGSGCVTGPSGVHGAQRQAGPTARWSVAPRGDAIVVNRRVPNALGVSEFAAIEGECSGRGSLRTILRCS